MRITGVRAHQLRIPYDAGAASFKQGVSAITALDEMIRPQARGLELRDHRDIPRLMEGIQRNLHLFGRYGTTMFAICGLDIALWDLMAKAQGVPLRRLLSGTGGRNRIPAYASLLHIGDPALVAQECAVALAKGYRAIKLHEATVPAVAAAQKTIGSEVPPMMDRSCSMDEALTRPRLIGAA